MAQGTFGTADTPLADLYSEQLQLTPVTSDPSSPTQGDMWLRSDLDSGDKIATIRFEHASGTWDIPVFGTGESTGTDIKKVLPIQTPNGEGFVPLQEGGGTFKQLAVQHGGVRHGWHNGLFAIPDSGVSRWEFEQDVTDSWGDNNGTDNTSAGYTTDAAVGSYAKSFDGVDDYVDTSYTPPLEASFTCWVRAGDNSDIHEVMNARSGSDGMYTRVRSGIFSAEIGNSSTFASADSTTSISTGTWYFVGGIYDQSNGEVIVGVNGSFEDTTSVGRNQNGTLVFGARSDDLSNYFSGDIDDARVYDKALTETEFDNLYQTGSING